MTKKVVLCAVNAKYIHSNLAVRYLKSYCETAIEGLSVAEFSINDNINSILKRLYNSNADIFGFSCYIWNISLVLDICSSLKKIRPDAVIILGGPEVSYDPAAILNDNAYIDYIVVGEGEATLLDLLNCIIKETGDISKVRGIAYRHGSDTAVTRPRQLIPALDELPFPYDNLGDFENKVIYYETSRGCPFNCQYCLSSTIHGVRYLSMERLQQDIKSFVHAGVKQVKLVDRTFNCNIERSIEIMEYIMKLGSKTNFHFEIAADLINEHFLKAVGKAPAGMFQFEIGVQSTNTKTLSEIKRKMDFDKVRFNVTQLMSFGNSHIHLDLIAGLPHEDMLSFEKSFNDVYALKPDMLQLGFLKLLKGSGIRESCERYGIEHHDFPPYEVIKTDWMSFKDMLALKDVEHVLELYHNSGKFRHTLDFLLQASGLKPFEFYLRLSDYWNLEDHFNSSKSMNELYIILKEFAADTFKDRFASWQFKLLNEYLKLDWLLYGRSGNMPAVIERFDHSLVKEQLQHYLIISLPEAEGFEAVRRMSRREILKHVSYEVFLMDIFSGSPNECRMVMFYLLKSESGRKMPIYTVVPLEEILQHSGSGSI